LNHCYHLVNHRPWPLIGSLGTIILLIGSLNIFHFSNFIVYFIGIIIILLTIFQWWRDISRERSFQGFHILLVIIGLKLGIILFIISEIFFFFCFFWSFFHSRLSPTLELRINWPPKGIESFNPFKIPLLNTIILLTSGISVTWAHHSLINKNFNQVYISLLLTIILGKYFSILQSYE
jgi:cytochrome c oxidase subunit 3